uniref:SAM domain-containing protein n=1 Tax=Macrostomum lignano TaxID=282301 RepID=A0A1I8IS64_9PLAT
MAISAAVNSEASSEHLDRLRRRYSEATSEYARLLERACAGRLAECQQLRLRLQSSSAESETAAAAAAADASDADTVRIDPDMAAWAEREARVSSVDVAVLALQDFDLETLLLCDKEDLSRAPIRGGAVVRLWQAILRHRASQQQQQQQQSSSEAPGNPGTEAQH